MSRYEKGRVTISDHPALIKPCCLPQLEVAYRTDAIVEASVFNKLLAVSCHDPLVRSERVGIQDRWGREQWDVGRVEVARVQH